MIDAGKSVEYDTPYNLLVKQTGYFKEMVQALGHKEFERFLEIAKSKQNLWINELIATEFSISMELSK